MISPAISPSRNGYHVGEGHGECTSARRDSEPVSEARSVERSPYDDGVVPERHPLVRWGEVGER